VDVYAGGLFAVSDMCECVIDGWGGVGGRNNVQVYIN
jgi:hypothetical protein